MDEVTGLTKKGWKGVGELYLYMWGGYHFGFPLMFATIDWMCNWVSLWLADWLEGKPSPDGWASDLLNRWKTEVLETFNVPEILGEKPSDRSTASLVFGGIVSCGHFYWDDINDYINRVQGGEEKSDLPEFIQGFLGFLFKRKEEVIETAKKTWKEGAEKTTEKFGEVLTDFDSSKIGKTIDTIINTPNQDEAAKKAEEQVRKQETYNKKSSKSEAQKFLGSNFACYKYGWAWDNTGLCYTLNTETGQWERRSDKDNKQSEYYPCE